MRSEVILAMHYLVYISKSHTHGFRLSYMCMQLKRFYNKWLHSWQWVPCGHCPACLQAKANKRTQRIKHASYEGYITLFVTLTYRNINIPYIRKDEIKENSLYINIYRDCSVRRVRIKGDYSMAYKYYREKVVVDRFSCFENRIFPVSSDVSHLPKLRGQSDDNKVGVLYFKDVQDFEKRLRTNLVRRYGVSKPIYSFKCSELGPSSQRPHFHLLISVPSESLAQLQSAIIESWPYDSRIKSAKSIQIARNAASYVSSYVNRGSDFPKFFEHKKFCPKHSFSKGYGSTSRAFTLPNILAAFRRGDLRYDDGYFLGYSAKHLTIYPQYACNKYFRKCYGFSRMSYDEIINMCEDPYGFFETSDIIRRFYLKTESDPRTHTLKVTFTGDYDYDWDKINSTIRLILRLRSRFLADFEFINEVGQVVRGLPENVHSYRLFGDYYYRFWSVYHSTLLRAQYEDIDKEDIPFLFENWDEVYTKGIRSDILTLLPLGIVRFEKVYEYARINDKLVGVLAEPSLFKRNVNQSIKLICVYKSCYKRRKLTNRVMVENMFNV